MKIIKPGIMPGTTPQAATCQNCTAIIEFTPSEVRRVSDQRDGDYYSFACMCCGHMINCNVQRGYNGPG